MEKNKKTKKVIVVFIFIFIFIFICMIIYKELDAYIDEQICDPISDKLDSIIRESYANYGNIKYSEYKDVISSHDYEAMYYIKNPVRTDSENPHIDRAKYDILISYHSKPKTVLVSSDTAISTYTYRLKYLINKTPKYHDDGHTYYGDADDYTNESGCCVVVLKLKSDNKWHVMSFSELD